MAVARVTTDGITDSAVNSAKIGVDVIAAEDLAANSVTVAEIQDGAVSTAKVADGAVTHAKLHSAALSPIALDQSNNRVGIGTASPSYTLHSTTSSGSDFAGFFHNSSGSGNSTALIAKGGANNSGAGTFIVQDYGGNEDFKVDGLGRVTYPNQPMVRLRLSSHVSPSTTVNSATKITTWQVNENIGNHWDNSNAQWTCPVAGVYEVSAFFIKYPASGNGHVDIYKNGSMVNEVRWRVHEGGSSYHQAGGNTYITCAANDILYWTYFGGAGIHSSNGAWTIRLAG